MILMELLIVIWAWAGRVMCRREVICAAQAGPSLDYMVSFAFLFIFPMVLQALMPEEEESLYSGQAADSQSSGPWW